MEGGEEDEVSNKKMREFVSFFSYKITCFGIWTSINIVISKKALR